MLNIVVPMAGKGSRFAGGTDRYPKPLIEVVPGKRMIEFVIDYLSVQEPHRFIFVCLDFHVREYALSMFFGERLRDFAIVETNTVTTGPAASVLLARSMIDSDDELLVAYADGAIQFPIGDFIAFARQKGADGATVTYPSDSLEKSYVEVGPGSIIRAAAEKKRISETASDGLYYFRNGRDFVAAAERMIVRDRADGRESFVCPVFNELIESGGLIVAYPISPQQRLDMGTPHGLEQVRRFLMAPANAGVHV